MTAAAVAVREPGPALTAAAADLAAASLAPATRRAYRAALGRLDSWRAGRELSDATLADYLAGLHAAGRSPQVAAQVVQAVRWIASATGRPDPRGPATKRVMAGIRREGRGRGTGQVAGVRWEQADAAAAIAANAGGSLAGLRDAAVIAVMSDCLFRAGECAALAVADLEAEGPETITVHRSKTDQEGAGAALYASAATIARIRRWLEAAGIAEGPVFRRVRRGGQTVGAAALSGRAIRDIVRKRAAAAGIEGRVSGHSLRVGSAQSLAAAGAGLVEMQTAGRWLSPAMPGRYARGQLARRGAVARLRYGAAG